MFVLLSCIACTHQSQVSKSSSITVVPQEKSLTGNWLVSFKVDSRTLKSNMHLVQSGNQFIGEGTDEDNNRAYTIEDGVIDGNQVYFRKVYMNTESTSPPIEYTGQYQILNTNGQHPYLRGQYTTLFKGQKFSGDWESFMNLPSGTTSVTSSTTALSETSQHAPDISGKWKLGYEYNFKIIKSTMFLEQEDGKLAGHGTNSGSTARFNIRKGWYSYPKVAFVLEYYQGNKNNLNQSMIFKGDVTAINESDYQGLYISGKTQGGGNWEAEQIK